jgi:hypothetical protein
MSRRIAGWLWASVFGIFLILSIDLWAWKGDFLVIGLPYAVASPFFLCLCLSLIMYIFAKTYWIEGDR